MPHPHPPLLHSAAPCPIDLARRQSGSTLTQGRRIAGMEQLQELLGKLTDAELEEMLRALREIAA